MSKLYTEEEVINFLNNVFVMENWIDVAINSLTPIQLPTDEEILEKVNNFHSLGRLGFNEGAKWMRDKIKGGNNEN